MKINLKKAGLAIAAAAALLLTSCSPGGGSASDDDTFVVVLGANPAHLNPVLSSDDAVQIPGQALFEPLVTVDGAGKLVPMLATKWEANADDTQFTITLRDDVKWHDGEKFSSKDVKFVFDELLELSSIGAAVLENVASVETPDATTVVVKMKNPFGPLMESLTNTSIMPAHVFQGRGDFKANAATLNPIGTGPYMFVSFKSGESVVVEKNDDWWGGEVAVKRVVFQVIPDMSARVFALQNGDVDHVPASFLDISELDKLKADSRIHLFTPPGNTQNIVLFYNTREGLSANYDLRVALYHAIDRAAIVKNVFLDTATIPDSIVPNDFPWGIASTSKFSEQFKYDPKLAGELLDKAGYPMKGNERFSIRLNLDNAFPLLIRSAEVVKANLEAVGIKVDMQVQETSLAEATIYQNHDFDLAMDMLGVIVDPMQGMPRIYVCNPNNTSYANPTGTCDAKFDGLVFAGAQSSDRTDRQAAYGQADRELADRLLHVAPLINAPSYGASTDLRWSGVEGLNANSKYDWTALKRAD